MPSTILVVDDEPKIVSMIAGYLEASGFSVLRAFDGNEAVAAIKARSPDCVVLDINMPGLDGLSVAREARKTSDVPIIFLTALADEVDRVVGLELGADDYVSKPFSPRELVARVKAVLRRSSPKEAPGARPVVRGAVSLDPVRRAVSVGGRPCGLTSAQFRMLAVMMRAPGRVWTRLELLEASSGSGFEGYERTVDAHVKNLRKTLCDDSDRPRYIETVRGAGYRFMEQPDEA